MSLHRKFSAVFCLSASAVKRDVQDTDGVRRKRRKGKRRESAMVDREQIAKEGKRERNEKESQKERKAKSNSPSSPSSFSLFLSLAEQLDEARIYGAGRDGSFGYTYVAWRD